MKTEDKKIEESKIEENKTTEENNKVEENKRATSCRNWFGYLGKRKKGEEIPSECIVCQKSIECMLNKREFTETAPLQ